MTKLTTNNGWTGLDGLLSTGFGNTITFFKTFYKENFFTEVLKNGSK